MKMYYRPKFIPILHKALPQLSLDELAVCDPIFGNPKLVVNNSGFKGMLASDHDEALVVIDYKHDIVAVTKYKPTKRAFELHYLEVKEGKHEY